MYCDWSLYTWLFLFTLSVWFMASLSPRPFSTMSSILIADWLKAHFGRTVPRAKPTKGWEGLPSSHWRLLSRPDRTNEADLYSCVPFTLQLLWEVIVWAPNPYCPTNDRSILQTSYKISTFRAFFLELFCVDLLRNYKPSESDIILPSTINLICTVVPYTICTTILCLILVLLPA